MNRPADFKKRLLQAEAPVKEQLLAQVFASRSRRKRMRIIRIGVSAAVGCILLLVGWLYFRPGMMRDATSAATTQVEHPELSEASESAASTIPKPQAENKNSALSATNSKSGKTSLAPVPAATSRNKQALGFLNETNIADPEAIVVHDDGSWTVYPPLSALPQRSRPDFLDQMLLGSRGYKPVSWGLDKPQASEPSSMRTGRRITTSTWLIDLMTAPALMQVRASNPFYHKLLHQTEQHGGSMQAGIRVGRQLNNQFRWFAGVNYTEQWSKFDWLKQTEESKMLTDVKTVVIKEPGLPDRTISVHDTTILHSVHQTHYTSANRSRLFSLPLGIQYTMQGTGIYVFGALAPGYVFRTSGMRMQVDGSVAFMEDLRFMRRFQLDGSLGLGIRKTLARGIFFTLEPRLNYGLLNASKTSSAHHLMQLGFNAGISFRPGR
ncbi:MAG: hypothetical protein RL160_718 [Bacteroidota bacterium]|jgi:hypothetical protein